MNSITPIIRIMINDWEIQQPIYECNCLYDTVTLVKDGIIKTIQSGKSCLIMSFAPSLMQQVYDTALSLTGRRVALSIVTYNIDNKRTTIPFKLFSFILFKRIDVEIRQNKTVIDFVFHAVDNEIEERLAKYFAKGWRLQE